jgi:hypothetical protein
MKPRYPTSGSRAARAAFPARPLERIGDPQISPTRLLFYSAQVDHVYAKCCKFRANIWWGKRMAYGL